MEDNRDITTELWWENTVSTSRHCPASTTNKTLLLKNWTTQKPRCLTSFGDKYNQTRSFELFKHNIHVLTYRQIYTVDMLLLWGVYKYNERWVECVHTVYIFSKYVQFRLSWWKSKNEFWWESTGLKTPPSLFCGDLVLSSVNSKYHIQKSIYGAAVFTLRQICCFFSFWKNNNLMGNIY